MLNDLYQTLDPIAFSIGPFSARWYGIAYALGFLLAAVVIYFVGKRWKMRFDFENICVVIICAMVGVIIGGKMAADGTLQEVCAGQSLEDRFFAIYAQTVGEEA